MNTTADPVILDLEPIEREQATPGTAVAELAADNSPAGMMMQALGRGANLQDIAQMLTLQERWEAGQARKSYNVAFAAFKAEAVHIIKN